MRFIQLDRRELGVRERRAGHTIQYGYGITLILCRFLKIRNCELQALLPFLRGIELDGIDSFEESIPGDESIPLWNRFL